LVLRVLRVVLVVLVVLAVLEMLVMGLKMVLLRLVQGLGLSSDCTRGLRLVVKVEVLLLVQLLLRFEQSVSRILVGMGLLVLDLRDLIRVVRLLLRFQYLTEVLCLVLERLMGNFLHLKMSLPVQCAL